MSNVNSRRYFISKLGAGVSMALASATMGTAEPCHVDNLSLRVALLEEEKALRQLHRDFEQALDQGRYAAVMDMFGAESEVVFNGGVFKGRQGVSRLYGDHFRSGKTGRRMEPAPGFELADQQRDSVEVAADRLSAKAVFPYSIQVGMPLESETSLVAMARLHGEGVRTWWEGGVYRVNYRRDVAEGRWKISRLEYDTLSRADYRAGRSYARPISVAPFSTRFAQDQMGPDELV